jgi:hypothetical protein
MKYYAYMQRRDEKTLQLKMILGKLIKSYREENIGTSCNNFEREYDLSKGCLNRIENGVVDAKFITLWKISEGLGLKFSEFCKLLEDELGDDFKLIDE